MSITKFYTDQEIFITGGSGFIGKSLIEKILRSFSNFGKMYILMRPKKNMTAEERLKELLKDPIFKRAHREQPESFKKVFVVVGDIKEIGLSMSQEDLNKLQNVTIIVHSAASVRFDDHFQDAVLLNTRGTHEMIKIAENLKKLKAFIYVSTTYSNPDKHVVNEQIYPACADWLTTIKLAETYDKQTLNVLFPKYSSHHPNTYTFTKSLAEQIINDYKHKLPLMLFRPSIVVSSIMEPVPGWMDNFNGPNGMLVACGIGILRTNHANPDAILDFIPVDVTTQGIIIAAYKVGQREQPTAIDEPLEVINCSVAKMRSVTIGQVIEIGKKMVRKNPIEKGLWLPEGSITRCAVWHYLRFFTTQIGLSIIVDCLLRLIKRKPFLLKLQRRIHSANKAIYKFLLTEWLFVNDNFLSLKDLIPPEDLYKLGMFTYESIETLTIFKNNVRGAKEFLLNELPDASMGARIRMKIFFTLHHGFQVIGVLMLLRYLMNYVYQQMLYNDWL